MTHIRAGGYAAGPEESIAELAGRLARLSGQEDLDEIADVLVRASDGAGQDTDDIALLLLKPC